MQHQIMSEFKWPISKVQNCKSWITFIHFSWFSPLFSHFPKSQEDPKYMKLPDLTSQLQFTTKKKLTTIIFRDLFQEKRLKKKKKKGNNF